MDQKTLNAYKEKASEYSEDWFSQPVPSDMYELLKKYFHAKGKTIDVGCGNGRDANWLQTQGFLVEGVDASQELLTLAQNQFPKIKFTQSFLPELKEVKDTYDNVLCETVIMHLPKEHITEAVQRIKSLLSPKGILYLSWRVTEKEDTRHNDGRLYSAFEPESIVSLFDKNSILHFEDKISVSSGKRICRFVYKNR